MVSLAGASRRRATSLQQHPDRDPDEQQREAERERPCRQTMLQRRSGDGAEGGGNADERRVHRPDVAVHGVHDRAGGRRDPDRRKRRRRRGPKIPVRDEQQQGNDDDPAADAEECAEEPCRQADQDQNWVQNETRRLGAIRRMRCKDAGSADSSTIGATSWGPHEVRSTSWGRTEDAATRRRARSDDMVLTSESSSITHSAVS